MMKHRRGGMKMNERAGVVYRMYTINGRWPDGMKWKRNGDKPKHHTGVSPRVWSSLSGFIARSFFTLGWCVCLQPTPEGRQPPGITPLPAYTRFASFLSLARLFACTHRSHTNVHIHTYSRARASLPLPPVLWLSPLRVPPPPRPAVDSSLLVLSRSLVPTTCGFVHYPIPLRGAARARALAVLSVGSNV